MEDGPSPGGESEDRQQQRLQLVVGRKEEEGKKKEKKEEKEKKKKARTKSPSADSGSAREAGSCCLASFPSEFLCYSCQEEKEVEEKENKAGAL